MNLLKLYFPAEVYAKQRAVERQRLEESIIFTTPPPRSNKVAVYSVDGSKKSHKIYYSLRYSAPSEGVFVACSKC